jgi:ABC-2 type transport system permease protein
VALEAPVPVPGASGSAAPLGDADEMSDSRAGVADIPVPGEAAAFAARPKLTRVVSADVSVWQRIGDIWRARELWAYLVRTEIKVKYKNSILGLVWSMIAPAMTLAIYFIVFQFIAKNGVPNFVIFLFSGLLVWNVFQFGVQSGTGVVVSNAGLVKKVSFPREILALASVGSATVFFFFQAIVMVIFMVVLHSSPDWSYLPLLPLSLLACLLLASGLAVLLSAVNVYLRDTQHLVEVLLTAWFWACPIVYAFQSNIAAKLGPKGLTWVYFLNPLTPLVLSFQRVLYAHVVVRNTVSHAPLAVLPPHGFWWYAALDTGVLVLSAMLCLVGTVVFGRLEGNFAEEL